MTDEAGADSAGQLEYRLLGPLTVTRAGQPLAVGGAKQRALLAILLVERNHPIATDRLIDLLWGGRPPASASSTLHGYLSHLRAALRDATGTGSGPLETVGHGYVLRTPAHAVDADRFAFLAAAGAQALRAGDPARALELLDDALALWRGRALEDVLNLGVAHAEEMRLTELRASALEDRIDAGLALGRHAQLLPELRSLVHQEPLRERLLGQLVLALYRSGRQADALEVLRDARQRLSDDLGIDPGPQLQRLEQAVLRQDPDLDLSSDLPGRAARTTSEPRAFGVTGPTSNLPAPLTSIVGRAAELDDVIARLRGHRLVTLTGAGGTGKTRLAVEVATRLREEHLDGPWLVELDALSEPALVPAAVAQSLGLLVEPGRPVVDALAEVLTGRRTVLLLDNCEHLLGAVADLVEVLLGRCPDLRILATSREPLQVAGESAVVVSPLPVVGDAPGHGAGPAVDGDALLLFAVRAAAVVPGFALDETNRHVVERICAELDGLPLAIELAAARLRVLSPDQLADHLGDRFALLAGGSRTAPSRQRTLLATVAWSVDLLDDAQRRLLAELSVFSGGFELDAVAQLCALAPVDVLDGLGALVAKSLVSVDTDRDPRRYGLLVTIREYGRRQLDEEARHGLSLRHARWCAALTAEGEQGLRGPDWLRWLRRLDAEHANVRTAVSFALEDGDADLAAAILGPLGWYWYRRGRIDEARRWLERCAAERDGRESEAWSRVVMSLATVRYLSGDALAARRLADQAIHIAQASAAAFAEAQATLYSAYFEAADGLDAAQRRAERGHALVRDLGLPWLVAEAVTTLSHLARVRGEHDRAELLVIEGVERAREAGYLWQERSARWSAAKVALARGDGHVALGWLRGVVADLSAADDRAGVLLSLHVLAGAAALTHGPSLGATLLGAMSAHAERTGFHPERVEVDGGNIRARIRASLDERAYIDATSRGRRMSAEELAALVDELTGSAEPAGVSA